METRISELNTSVNKLEGSIEILTKEPKETDNTAITINTYSFFASSNDKRLTRALSSDKLQGKECMGKSYDNFHDYRLCEVNTKLKEFSKINPKVPNFVILQDTSPGAPSYKTWCMVFCTIEKDDLEIFGNGSNLVFKDFTDDQEGNRSIKYTEIVDKEKIKSILPNCSKEIDETIKKYYPIK